MSPATPAGSPLRIAIFGESYLPYLSGVTVATETLARGLGAAGHDVILAVPRPADRAAFGGTQPATAGALGPDPQMAWLPSYQGFPPAPPGYRMPWPIPSATLARVRRARPQIVHAQSPFVSGLMARRIARTIDAPLVFTHHTRFGDYRHYLGPLAAPGGGLVTAYLAAFWAGCAAIVAPSPDLADEIRATLRARAGSHRPIVRSIPTGLDIERIGALAAIDPRPSAGWPTDAVVAVSVGRLAREKNVGLLLEAFARAARRDARLRLLLVGDGPLRAWLEAKARDAGLEGRVQLAGSLPRMEALAYAAGGDLFLFASQTETQGMVLAEALSTGLPVLALDGPGVRGSVRDGIDGMIVEHGEEPASALAEALLGLAADPDRRAALSRAARDGAERFAIAVRIAEMVALYRSLVDPAP